MDIRFRRNLYVKSFFAHVESDWLPDDLYDKSEWDPPIEKIPMELRARTCYFLKNLKNGFLPRRRCAPNLNAPERNTLEALSKSTTHVVATADKGLGAVVLERPSYVHSCFSLLLDETTYRRLTKLNACYQAIMTHNKILAWIEKFRHRLSETDVKYLYSCLEKCNTFAKRVAHFYILIKIHKNPWKPRPIVSCPGSQLYSLGKWLNKQLQPIAQRLPSYIKDTFDLKSQIQKEHFDPARDRLFVADANSMYTNIDTTHALAQFRTFFETSTFVTIGERKMAPAILEALDILMRNNIIQFDDLFFQQKTGTAMGAPPAPPYATIYFAIHEIFICPQFPSLVFYRRYIDDAIGIWRRHPDPAVDLANWTKFQEAMNSYGILTWDPFTQELSVNFMDLTISYDPSTSALVFTVYEKKENFYLYLPPRSCHAPGIIYGTILGTLFRYRKICSRIEDFYLQTEKFFHRLVNQGHQPSKLQLLFAKAFEKLPSMILRKKSKLTGYELKDDLERKIFLHLDFNPFDPSRRNIQALAKKTLMHPPGEPSLARVSNGQGGRIGIEQLVIAYHRPKNIKDILVPRKFGKRPGPSASTYLPPNQGRIW